MIINTETDEFQITISIDDAFELLRGGTLTDKTYKHLCGLLGEWYHDTWLQRYVPEELKQEEELKK